MKERNADAVIAMDEGRCAGLFTAHDVLTRVIGSARDASMTCIADALSGESPCVDIDSTIGQTLALMDERPLRSCGCGRQRSGARRAIAKRLGCVDDPHPAGEARLQRSAR